ncbi:MAG: hypothetical protein J5I98_32700 [Phaeodactylibacter sp.]|nr:hypothetical protein [Phaeodactylibacter sp.]
MGLFSFFTDEELLLKRAIAGYPSKARQDLKRRLLEQLFVGNEEYKIESKPGRPLPEEAFQSFLEKGGEEDSVRRQSVRLRFKKHFDQVLADTYRAGGADNLRRLDNYLSKRFLTGVKNKRIRVKRLKGFEDAFSDAFVALIRILGSGGYKGTANLDTLFQSILDNCCRRQEEREKALHHIPAQPWKGTEEEFRVAVSEAAWLKIKGHLNNIDEAMLARDLELLREENPKCYQLLWMHAVQGFTHADIAERTDSTAAAVKVRAGRCREKLSALANTLKLKNDD